jgi:PAP2 superfamily
MRRPHLTTVALLAVAALALGAPAESGAHRRPATDTYVSTWDDVGHQAFTAAGLTPPEGLVILAYQSIAVYDAVMAVDGGYRPFAVAARAPRGASAQAAVAAAAHRILLQYLPAQGPAIVDPAYDASLATIPDGRAKTAGLAVGERIATALIAQRAGDGFRAPVTYTPPNPPIPGVWLPTAPTPPIGPYLGLMRPFSLASADQFRPGPPPALSSGRWARDYNEVKQIGSSTSTTRTAEQTLAARFWAEPPVQQDHAADRRFVADHALDIVQAARFMAMMAVTNADSLIACFDAKYHYAFWRPITAIRAGDTDGNPATVADPTWSSVIATPNHPEYPSAHSCVTAGGSRVFERFLGTRRIDVTVPSITGLGDRHFETVGDLQNEVGNARVWGGIHFRTAVEAGLVIGDRTAEQVLSRHFQRSRW